MSEGQAASSGKKGVAEIIFLLIQTGVRAKHTKVFAPLYTKSGKTLYFFLFPVRARMERTSRTARAAMAYGRAETTVSGMLERSG